MTTDIGSVACRGSVTFVFVSKIICSKISLNKSLLFFFVKIDIAFFDLASKAQYILLAMSDQFKAFLSYFPPHPV